jgi:hypothetical protein
MKSDSKAFYALALVTPEQKNKEDGELTITLLRIPQMPS